ncbi:uncharacterized protein [Clytia hemisphaerica]|uniref:Uncharacterized protein n=1 Tax=Clytia hemisphaerica TaxID=252671 RepID=A0A7M5V1K3_9CNID|eukprot:TCONS_00056562-protein
MIWSQILATLFLWMVHFEDLVAAISCGKMRKIPENNHGVEPMVLVDHEEVIELKTKRVIPVLSPEWSFQVKFNISANHTTTDDYCSIVHVAHNSQLYGKRTPALFYQRVNKELLVDSAVNGNNKYRNRYGIMLNTEYNVEIRQRYKSGGVYKYSIFLNGDEVHSTDNTQAQQFYDVTVYISNPWVFPCIGVVSELKMTNFL